MFLAKMAFSWNISFYDKRFEGYWWCFWTLVVLKNEDLRREKFLFVIFVTRMSTWRHRVWVFCITALCRCCCPSGVDRLWPLREDLKPNVFGIYIFILAIHPSLRCGANHGWEAGWPRTGRHSITGLTHGDKQPLTLKLTPEEETHRGRRRTYKLQVGSTPEPSGWGDPAPTRLGTSSYWDTVIHLQQAPLIIMQRCLHTTWQFHSVNH